MSWQRFGATVGHHAPRLLAIAVGVLIVLTLVPTVPSAAALLVLTVLLPAVVGLAVSIFVHNRHLCERCIASVPLDASNVASRYAVRFRVAHLFERKLFAVCYLAAVVALALVAAHPVGRYAWAATEASLVYLLLVYVTHQRLQPWCPQCRNGGEEATAPTTPGPVATHR